MHSAEGFLLLSLPQATLTTTTSTYTDSIHLECVTILSESASPFPDRDVYLVLRISNLEIPVDPTRNISSSARQDRRIYTFHATDAEPQFELAVPIPHAGYLADDLETFDQILTQYAQFYTEQVNGKSAARGSGDFKTDTHVDGGNEYEDLRGRLVLINESDGQIVGELDNQFNIREDSTLAHGLGENEPVVLDLPPDYDTATATGTYGQRQSGELTAREAFVHAVPSEERDLVINAASLVSHAISATTTLLLSGVRHASNYYVKHSEPSSRTPSAASSSSNLTANLSSRDHLFKTPVHGVVISHPRTRSALTQAHAVSGTAVKVSGKTIEVVEGLIKKAIGAKQGPNNKSKRPHPLAPQSRPIDYPPPAYANGTPPLPPRKGSPQWPSSSSHYTPRFSSTDRGDVAQGPVPLPKPRPLRTRDRILLSADLILSTVEESARRILDVGSDEVTKVVAHKHGQEAGDNAALATGTARNVALVYIDMRGVGRRAIIKKTGREFVKARIRSHNSSRQDVSPSAQQQSPHAQYPGTYSPRTSSTSVPTYFHGLPGSSLPPPRPNKKKG